MTNVCRLTNREKDTQNTTKTFIHTHTQCDREYASMSESEGEEKECKQ